ncbi:FAD-binding protein [Frondihabitans cladoniiphilus]|uniref:FAD-binding protein n=1 Tax=Frondihabitans cladoniiphilus TaxID=715785 RepID=A0ABP8VIC5_9MICO
MEFTTQHEQQHQGRQPGEAEARTQNWSGTYAYRAQRILTPASIDELQETVAAEGSIRALGTRHSFNDVADGPGVLVTTTAIAPDVAVAADRLSVTVGSGTRYAVLAEALEQEGLALHNMGSLPHISVGGATATGTHGSGTALGSLSTAVSGLDLVGADGSIRRLTRADPEFAGSVVALGALGVVSRVTLDVQPHYRVRQDVYAHLPWRALEGDGLRAVMAAGYSVSLFTVYGADVAQVWVKTRIPEGEADAPVPDDLFGARRVPERPDRGGPDDNTTPMDGSVGPWSTRLPHFRIDRTPSSGDEIQTEYFVSIDDGAAALAEVRKLADRIQPHLLVTELRAVAADSLWLGETQGRDSLCIHFTWKNHPHEIGELLPDIEAALRPFDARPHWGKVARFETFDLAALYPRLGDFRRLVAAHDPGGKFRGPFLDRVLL